MPRTTIAAQSYAGAYPALPITPGAADVIFTATDDPTDRETPLVDGKTVIHAYNSDSVARTITIGSQVDTYNRVGDITAYSVAAGKTAHFGPFKTLGWALAGKLNIDVSSPLLRLAVITLP